MMKNLRVKFVMILLLMMTVSGVCSIIISSFIFSGTIQNESRESQKRIANTILDLYNNTNYSIDKIIDLSNWERYEVSLIDKFSKYSKDIDTLNNGEFIQVNKKGVPLTDTIVNLDQNYIKISNSFNAREFHIRAFFLAIVALIISTIIAAIMSGLASKRILEPIRALNKATEEVAKGDFDVQLEIPKEYEFAILTKKFNKMVHELSGIETLRSDFVSNVSHEIKTPLASIQGFAKLVQDKNFNEEERSEFAEIIINESQRLSKLTSNVLKLSKLENQEIITEKTKFSLDEQIRCAILILEPEWSSKNIDLDIELEAVNIIENEDLLQQVWLNLIGNAIKFTNDCGSIGVNLASIENNIIVKISDNGLGMDKETQGHIFEKFYQGDKSHLSNGNGLGLALVKRIIELCNGEIEVKSKVGEGSTFIVKLEKM